MKIGIVGAGVVGSVIGAYLEKRGHIVETYDSEQPMGASKAALGLIAPQWVSKINNVEYGLEVLRGLGHIEEYEFEIVNPVHRFKQTIKRFNVQQLIATRKVNHLKVMAAKQGIIWAGGTSKSYDRVIIAAGFWSDQLADVSLTGKAGAIIKFPTRERLTTGNQVKLFAPFRQAVTFDTGKGETWFGDGTAYKAEKGIFTPKPEKILERAHAYAGLSEGSSRYNMIWGTRPFVQCNPNGLCKKLDSKTWIATGGGKNGTVLAGIWARKIAEDLAN